MMAWYDHIHQVIGELYPGARHMHNYQWATSEEGQEPEMVHWDPSLGSLDIERVRHECERVSQIIRVPNQVSNSDFRAAMLITDPDAFGLLNAEILSWENDPSLEKRILRQRWEYANVFMRSMLHEAAPLLGRTEQEIDQLLVLAKSLNN